MRPGKEAGYSPPTSAEVKNENVIPHLPKYLPSMRALGEIYM